MKRLNSTVTMVQLGPTLLSEKSDIRLTRNMADRSAENHRVGNISISAWHLEDRAEQRMSLSHIPESVGGRVRADGGGGGTLAARESKSRCDVSCLCRRCCLLTRA